MAHYNSTGEDHAFVQQNSTNNAPIRATSITSSWVYTPNSTVVNEARFGYNRTTFDFVNIDVNTPASSYGINTGVTNPLSGGLPSIVITGFGNGGTPVLGTAFNRPQYFTPNPYFDIQDSVSILKGKHSFKIGGEYTHLEADAQVFNNGRGADLISWAEASDPHFLVRRHSKTSSPERHRMECFSPVNRCRNWTARNYAFYAQDDWRVTPRLILNLGLRYNLLTPNEGYFWQSRQLRSVVALWNGSARAAGVQHDLEDRSL